MTTDTEDRTAERLDYLRGQIEAQRISYSEIAELQGLADQIDPSDVVLLQWAGVPETDDEDGPCVLCDQPADHFVHTCHFTDCRTPHDQHDYLAAGDDLPAGS